MKKKMTRILGAISVVGVCSAALVAGGFTKPTSQNSCDLATLGRVAIAEFPAQAAAVVKQAEASKREDVARAVVRLAAATSKPCTMPYIVSAICRAVPEVAAAVAATATAQQPDQIIPIAKAAAAAAPTQAQNIVAALCKEQPQSFAPVALVVGGESPGSDAAILKGIVASIPELTAPVEQAAANLSSREIKVIIPQAAQLAAVQSIEKAKATQRQAVEETLLQQNTASQLAVNQSLLSSRAIQPLNALSLASLNNLEQKTKAQITAAEKATSLLPENSATLPVLVAAAAVSSPTVSWQGPSVKPPYVPPSGGTPTIVTITNSTAVPPGSRNYAEP